MYMFDLEANPSESVVEGCGTDRSLGPVASCANLYSIPAFRDARKKLEGILLKADRESVAPTLRWEDDGPLADPSNFGGWVPWRDSSGVPLAIYGGVEVDGASEVQQQGTVFVGYAGEAAGGDAITVTSSYARFLAMFVSMVAVGSVVLAYRAGQRSGYKVLR